MIQNTEQKMRTRITQLSSYPETVCVGQYSGKSWQLEMDADDLDPDLLIEGPVLYVRCDIDHRRQKEAEARGTEEQRRKGVEIDKDRLADLIEGMEVSVDVSTCENDAGNRLFGTVTVVQEYDSAKNGLILLVQEPEPNFEQHWKNAHNQEPVAWLIQDKNKGNPGHAYPSDRAVTNKDHADKAARFNSNVSPLFYSSPANVAAMEERIKDLKNLSRSALEWIDAVPAEVRSLLPTMPGFCRDWADSILAREEEV